MSVINYLKETKAEMKHVSWPTRKQSMNYTLLVIAISLVTAFILGFFDFIFTSGLEKIVETRPYQYNPSVQVSTTTVTGEATSSPVKFDLNL